MFPVCVSTRLGYRGYRGVATICRTFLGCAIFAVHLLVLLTAEPVAARSESVPVIGQFASECRMSCQPPFLDYNTDFYAIAKSKTIERHPNGSESHNAERM